MVFRAHVTRCVVASTGAIEMPQSNGQADVPKAVHTCDTETKVSKTV